jgi:indoleamine 2,3-dioxygenase
METMDSFWAPSHVTGFLPERVPLLPDDLASSSYPSLRALGGVASKLGRFSDAEIEEFVSSLPSEMDAIPEALDPAECEAAIRAYVNLAAHLIHRPHFAPQRQLPPAVARPLWAFSAHAGRAPSLTYASYVLANSTVPVSLRTPTRQLEIAQTPTGTADESWFVGVHLSVESAGGEVVAAIDGMETALDNDDEGLILGAIQAIESAVRFANDTMPTVRDRLDPQVFRDIIRPLLYGHDRILFCGVPGEPTVTYIGETGAQSGMIRAADVALAVEHSDAITTSLSRFLACAPPTHQRDFARAAAIGRRIVSRRLSPLVREARRAAIMALSVFRRTHLAVVSEYLAPGGQKLTHRGTGGTDFQVWLKRLIDETEAAGTIEARTQVLAGEPAPTA